MNQQLHNLASINGVDYFGVADLSQAYTAILEQGGSFIAGFPFSISIGISLLNPIVELLPSNRTDRFQYSAFVRRIPLQEMVSSSIEESETSPILANSAGICCHPDHDHPDSHYSACASVS